MVGLRKRHIVAAVQPSATTQISATATLNFQDHAGRTNKLTGDGSTLVTLSLPAATGSNSRYKFFVETTNTGTYTVNCAGSDEFVGAIMGTDESGEAEGSGWLALPADNFVQITVGTVAQGALGSWFEVHDIASAVWLAYGIIAQSGGSEATPFST